MTVAVSSEAVAEYLDLVCHHARRLDGMRDAEYDDLVQEGLLDVFLALRKGAVPSESNIVHAMHHWINKCAARGFTYLPADADLVAAMDEEDGMQLLEVRHATELP